jgi:predicted phage terminase large subunit-like protein
MTRHLAAIDQAIMDTILGRSEPILVIEAPPRHGKSELVSRYLPAWYLATFPSKRVMLVGYSAQFACAWGRRARQLICEQGPALGLEIDPAVRAAENWGLAGHAGGMVTAGVGGPLTGRGANLLIIDDPVKNAEQSLSPTLREKHWDWWQTTASTRIEPGGCAIIIATRWNDDDLSGRLIRAAEAGTGTPVRRLRLPAIAHENDPLERSPGEALWPAQWPIQQLERIRDGKERGWWLAMYQQDPSRNPHSRWPADYFEGDLWVDSFPVEFELSAIAYDPAHGKRSGDCSAIVFAGLAQGLLWVAADIEQRPPEQAVRKAIDMAIYHRPDAVAIEANAFQSLLAPEFDRQCREKRVPPLAIHLIEQHTPKLMRIERLGTFLARKKIRLRTSPGCRVLLEQLQSFPHGAHDDGPDALELAIRMLQLLAAARQDPEDGFWGVAWA